MLMGKDKTILMACLVCVAFSVIAGDWTWRMPNKMYQNLDFEKRTTIDKAIAAYVKAEEATRHGRSVPDVQVPAYRAAVAEWKKYSVQYELDFEDDHLKAYVLFMQGLSLKGARDRNSATKVFEELLDFYPDQTWITPAAMFMIADNHYANGEHTKAKRAFLDMVSDPEAAAHPLACRAYNRIATIEWKLLNAEGAVANWHKATDPIYRDIATGDWNGACSALTQSYAIAGKWKELTTFILRDINPDDAKGRLKAIRDAEGTIDYHRSRTWDHWWYDAKYLDKPGERSKARRALNEGFAEWHESNKAIYMAQNQEWDFLHRAFNYRRGVSGQKARELIPDMTEYVKKSDEKSRPGRARTLAILLADSGLYQDAHMLETYIKDIVSRLWLSYEIDRRARAWDACILTLEQIIANKDPKVSLSGKKTLAWLYKDCKRDYEKALKIYLEISTPPGTLWDIQYCYRRLGEKAKAFAVLEELTFFPDQAASATWHMAEYHKDDGNKEKAIALYRRLLSHPEWKKSRESSWAHQRLEAWGIATGGAVIETIR